MLQHFSAWNDRQANSVSNKSIDKSHQKEQRNKLKTKKTNKNIDFC